MFSTQKKLLKPRTFYTILIHPNYGIYDVSWNIQTVLLACAYMYIKLSTLIWKAGLVHRYSKMQGKATLLWNHFIFRFFRVFKLRIYLNTRQKEIFLSDIIGLPFSGLTIYSSEYSVHRSIEVCRQVYLYACSKRAAGGQDCLPLSLCPRFEHTRRSPLGYRLGNLMEQRHTFWRLLFDS